MSTLVGAVAFFSSCGTDQLTSTTTSASALASAQCTYAGFKSAADACFATFHDCQAVAGADLAACHTALEQCLPPPPAGGPSFGQGGRCPNMDGGEHGPGAPPPPPPGGPGSPPPPGAPPPPGGPGHDGPGHDHGGPPPGGPPLPDSAAILACQELETTCLTAANADPASCHDASRSCVRDAFHAAFQARCDASAVTCASATADAAECARITARCTQGVDGLPPQDLDGGTCQ